MRLNREVGDAWMVAISDNNLGNATRGLGDFDAAQHHYAESLRAYREYDDKWALAFLVEDIGQLAAMTRRAGARLRARRRRGRAPRGDRHPSGSWAGGGAGRPSRSCEGHARRAGRGRSARSWARARPCRMCSSWRFALAIRGRSRSKVAEWFVTFWQLRLPPLPASRPRRWAWREHHADARGRHVRARVGSGRRARRRDRLRRPRRRLVLRLRHGAIGRPPPLRPLVDPGRCDDHQRVARADELHGLRLRRRPEHHASFLPDDSWAEGSVTWNTRPADGLVPQAPPAEWLLFGSPLSTSPANLGAAIGIRQCGLLRNRRPPTASSPRRTWDPHRRRTGRRRQALDRGLRTIPCGTPFSVACQNGQLEQSYFLRYYSKEQSLLNAPRLIVDYTATLAMPSLIQRRLDRRDRCVRDRARRRRLEPADHAGRVHGRDLHRRRAPGWRDARRRAGLGDDRCSRLLQRRRLGRDARRLRDRAGHRAVRDRRTRRASPAPATTTSGRRPSRSPADRDGARLRRLARQGALVQVRRHARPAHPDRALRPPGRLRPGRVQGHRPGVRRPARPGRRRRSDQAERGVRAVRLLALRLLALGLLAVGVQP